MIYFHFQDPPDLPAYMKKVRRVFGGKDYQFSKPPVNPRTTRGHYQAGFVDGRYHWVRTGEKPIFAKHMPINWLWYDDPDQRRYVEYHYALGFWLGQVSCLPRTARPPRDYYTLSDHRLLAKVRMLLRIGLIEVPAERVKFTHTHRIKRIYSSWVMKLVSTSCRWCQPGLVDCLAGWPGSPYLQGW